MTENRDMKNKILEYVFNISKQPILLRDLLVANRQYNEGMYAELF